MARDKTLENVTDPYLSSHSSKMEDIIKSKIKIGQIETLESLYS